MKSAEFEIYIKQWEPDNRVRTYFSLCFKNYFDDTVAFY